MFFALLANLRVDIVSRIASNAGDTIAIIVVLQLPPNEIRERYFNLNIVNILVRNRNIQIRKRIFNHKEYLYYLKNLLEYG